MADAKEKAQKQARKFSRPCRVEKALKRAPMKHSEIRAVVKDQLFYVEGLFYFDFLGPISTLGLAYIGRTMTVYKDGNGELTLFNSFQLTEDGWKELDSLGKVKNVVRIGAFHGGEDAILLNRYKDAKYWILEGMECALGLDCSHTIMKNSNVPIKGMKLFSPPNAEFPEAAVLLPCEDGVLVTCDMVQNQASLGGEYNSYFMRLFMYFGGFVGEGRVGPGWLDACYKHFGKSPEENMLNFFKDTLKSLDFDILMPGHGLPIVGNAKQKVFAQAKVQFGFDF